MEPNHTEKVLESARKAGKKFMIQSALDPEIFVRVVDYAEKSDRSRATVIRHAIELGLAQLERGSK
jgi:predicted transcriptional regulator